MKDLQMNKVDMDDVKKTLAPNFCATFETLLAVRTIEEKKRRAKAESASSSQAPSQGDRGRKRSPPSPLSIQPMKRIHGADIRIEAFSPKTPDRPTRAVNPDLSRETMKSGLSIQSKDEENIKLLGNVFIRESMSLLGKPFRVIDWQTSGRAVQLTSSYSLNCYFH